MTVDWHIRDIRCAHCGHVAQPNGNDWRCAEGCQCTMRGCALTPESRRLVEAKHRISVSVAHITPECRAGRGDEQAWVEAVARLRREYDAICAGWAHKGEQPTLSLVLEMQRP